MSSTGVNRYWIKAYIKGWSLEQGEYYAIISIPAKNLRKIKFLFESKEGKKAEEGKCYLLLESDRGDFIAIPINQKCLKTPVNDKCWIDKRYVYIKLKVKQNDLARDSIMAGFKEKVRLLLGHCEESIKEITNICELCVYGIEKLYKHGS